MIDANSVLDEFKIYARLDTGSYEDAVVTGILGAAIRYVDDIVTFEGDFPADLKQAVFMLAAHWYDHRSASGEDNTQKIPLGFDMLVLKYKTRFI